MSNAPKKVSKDLQEERNKVNFNVKEFTNWFYGGEDKVKEKRDFGNDLKLSSTRLSDYLHSNF